MVKIICCQWWTWTWAKHYASSVSAKIWWCRWGRDTAIIVSCGKHNCCLCWVRRTRGNTIQIGARELTPTEMWIQHLEWLVWILGWKNNLGNWQSNQNHGQLSSGTSIRAKWSLKDVQKKFRAIYNLPFLLAGSIFFGYGLLVKTIFW